MTFEPIADHGQKLAPPAGKVIGFIDGKAEFEAFADAVRAAGYAASKVTSAAVDVADHEHAVQIASLAKPHGGHSLTLTSEDNLMLTGKLISLVHLSQQRYMPNTRLIPDHNDKGYGIIEDASGGEVYFSHEAVENRNGFEDLRKGQQLEYTLEKAPYLRAVSVRMLVPPQQAIATKPAANCNM